MLNRQRTKLFLFFFLLLNILRVEKVTANDIEKTSTSEAINIDIKTIKSNKNKLWLDNSWVYVSSNLGINIGSFKQYIPYSQGISLGFQQNIDYFLGRFGNQEKRWIPDVLFQIGYNSFRNSPFLIDDFSFSLGFLWLLKIKPKMAGNIRISSIFGYSYLMIKAIQNSIEVVNNTSLTSNFQLNLGYEHSLNHLKILTDIGYQFIYDTELSISQVYLTLGVGYKLK